MAKRSAKLTTQTSPTPGVNELIFCAGSTSSTKQASIDGAFTLTKATNSPSTKQQSQSPATAFTPPQLTHF